MYIWERDKPYVRDGNKERVRKIKISYSTTWQESHEGRKGKRRQRDVFSGENRRSN